MAEHQHDDDHNCGCYKTTSSVTQTLDELDFERGLWSAALSGQTNEVLKRLNKGDDVNVKDKSGYTALHYAARNKHVDTVNVLLTHGANVNAVTNSGKATPLHRAAYTGSSEVVRILLQHKANPMAVDGDGMTPLHKAAEQRHTETVKILMQAAPGGITVQDSKGRTPADMTGDLPVKELLLQASGS